ncbi:uncharacterized protein LOC114147510 [Xiphophorus couchianus]|uniref:uncharacterized protein LOC114147510 n=1 Tax=Xiphophorus couchianus TaxID=32473 RepID=UPI0010161A0A|nr:uncharacterized protein LOC114147510 [Xiphophorus couchianus]XP_027877765.1 uncharacterized protein LOC114147510 [Xiphophorus couchianus]XP_027877766.1 uncharacterized protein LOC114147510 [Xiphophorus couchianus]
MALPADGSPKLEGLPDNGKEHGKVWSNETDMVSEDYGEGLRFDQLSSAVDRGSAASLHWHSEILEILPPNFKYIQDIGVDEKPEEDTAPCTSLEFTSGLDKQEEPILRSENSRPIGTSQHHQVGLEEDGASLTSGRARSITQKVDAAKEDNPPLKLSSGTVLPSSFKFTFGHDNPEEPILRPEDSIPISASPQPLAGWRNLVTFCRAIRIPKKVDAAKEDNPPLKLSFGTVLPSSFTFTFGPDKPDEPILRPEDSIPISASPQPLAGWRNLVTFCRAIRIPKKVDDAKEDDTPSKPSDQVGSKEDVTHATSVTGINGKRTRDSDAEEEPPAKRSKDTC